MQTPIYARAVDLDHLLDLKEAGATDAILENAEVLNFHNLLSSQTGKLSPLFVWRSDQYIQCLLEIMTKILYINADKSAAGF